MRREIDILLQAARRDCAVVEKDSNVLFNVEELLAARDAGRYGDEDDFLAPDPHAAVTGPYPGCMQLGAADPSREYRPVGQTTHFIIFAPSPPE